ncbi:uncharacterized protein LOC129598376 [Paramacrobiotus metropolitanus]|uniref:uncharacterized protein LOC129598376 n=1 Tax=Paramacrobiotus metropolitanus TaxID=2943436 RepID=UPI002445B4FE|nr:uncharacterized protein LOC129598376 [Paramacrobiotus metropolitanus]XP_055352224.1 uncharacterized protein LOC129598376 [Paramacrobiotus metropolitanus]
MPACSDCSLCRCRRRTPLRLAVGRWWTCGIFSVMLQLHSLHFSAGCLPFAQPPSSPPPAPRITQLSRKTGPDLNDMLADAWLKNRQDDRVTLPQLAVSDFVTDSAVQRPRLGEDATFQCEVPVGTDPDGRAVSWLHQDRTVFQAGRALPVEGSHRYNLTRVGSTLFFTVLNVSLASSGAVLCVAAPSGPAYAPRPRVLQRYTLLPLVTRRDDVFAAPDAPAVTATEGGPVTVPCSIRLPFPEGIFLNRRQHVLWRHNGRVVYGPSEAPYGALISATGLPQASVMAVHPNDTQPTNRPGQLTDDQYTMHAVTLADAGHVECWFRPHQGLHEWIVQSTKLTVFAKN